MIFGISRREIVHYGKLIIKVVILIFLIFFTIPNLINLIWNMSRPGIDHQEEKLLEKPLRVEDKLVNTT